jgi:hypothetical protein
MKQDCSQNAASVTPRSGKSKPHPCPWPFPTSPLNQLNGLKADSQSLMSLKSLSNKQNQSGQRTRSKPATRTYADMMTELGEAKC